ncbi:MAG TPA: hypothetical protein VIJ11_03330 [Galbitalea sp.]
MSTLVQIAGRPLTVRLARVALWLFLVASAATAAATLIEGVPGIVSDIVAGRTSVTLVADKALPAAAAGSSTTTLLHGSYGSAAVVLTHAPTAVAWLAIVGEIGQLIAQTSLAAAVGVVAWHVLRPRLFRRSLYLQFTVVGALVFVGGVLWQVGDMFAAGLAAVALDGSRFHGFWPLAGRLDPTFIVIGTAFVIIGLAFEYGGRLQKDAEGLV